LIQILFF